MAKEIPFKCPKCMFSLYEEVLVNVTIATQCRLFEDFDLRYYDAENSDGQVDRYQCSQCGYTIMECDSADQGELALKLAEVLKGLNAPIKKGDCVSFGDLIHRIADAYERLEGEELANLWNEMFSTTPVVYDGDSLFWVKE